jgi:hypothetical protein
LKQQETAAAFPCRALGFCPGEHGAASERARGKGIQVAADMSFRIGGDDRDDGDEELFRAAHAVSGGEDHFPEAGGVGDHHGSHRMFVPQPLRRMNSDSIYDCTSSMTAQLPAK